LPAGDWSICLDTSGVAHMERLPARSVVLFEARRSSGLSHKGTGSMGA
jgi:hypothetical protein